MIHPMSILFKIILSTFFGALIGMERETKKRPAGFRTYTLIALGSTLFTIMSMNAFENSDTSRVVAQIVTGIGFLGAGTIFREQNKITGLTTAAGMWAMAAIGIAVGAGFYFMAAVATVVTFLVLQKFQFLKKKKDKKKVKKRY